MAELSSILSPQDGESLERFTVRCHKSLLADVPDPDTRNAMIWDAWRDANGQLEEERIASHAFPAEKYTVSPSHCHWVEHQTIGKDGKPRKYDLKTLAKIARQHNTEIRDAGVFPALSDGHTPEDQSASEPAVLGHAGPYRLGMVGRENPRFAMFADEYHRKDSADVLSRKPFRSVELWTFKDGRQRFHPIAAVGSESPRLLMPAKYTEPRQGQFADFEFQGADVERYTSDAVDVDRYQAAMAGGSNTFTKSFQGGERTDYAKDAPGTTPPDTLRDLMSMLLETPQFRWLTRKMEEEESLAGAGPGGGEMPGQMASPIDDQMQPGLDGDLGDEIPGDDLSDMAGEEPPAAAGPPDTSDLDDFASDDSPAGSAGDDDSPAPKSAKQEKHSMAADPNVVSIEKYTALESAHNELMGDHKKLLDRVTGIERVSADRARKAEIDGLAEKYTAVNADEECKKCLYSQGSSMTDEAFRERMDTIKSIGEQFENSPMIPKGSLPPERYTSRRDADLERYEQRLSEEAVNYHTEQLAIGKNVPYDVCKAEAKKRLASSNGHAAATA